MLFSSGQGPGGKVVSPSKGECKTGPILIIMSRPKKAALLLNTFMDFKEWLMKTPSFSIVGGKSRLRNWLFSFFPKAGRIYVEPFAGKGNVFFKARQELNFQKWHINDLNAHFFDALLNADLKKLPKTITTKKSWEYWKKQSEKGNPVGHLLEPEVTWGGKGWKSGARLGYLAEPGKEGSHPPYRREKFITRAEMARELLSGEDVIITSGSWEKMPWKSYGPKDFVYLDPPYHGSPNYYGEIDHSALLAMLTSAAFRWALSGYNTDLYAEKLKKFRMVSKDRNAELRSSNTGKREPVSECLWRNY